MAKLRFILCLVALLSFALDGRGADRITASVTITNAPTTNSMTFVVTTTSASTRTWTNSVQVASSQVLTNETGAGSATNLALQLAATPPAGAIALLTGASNITIYGGTGVPLTISGVGSYFSVTYATNSITNAWTLRIPASVESPAQRTNSASGIVSWINRSENTNEIEQASKASTQLLGTTNTQTVAGAKYFTNATGQWFGIVSNSPAISGTVSLITNGLWRGGYLTQPTTTNGAFYGANTFYGSADFSGSLTFNAYASTISSDGDTITIQPESGARLVVGTSGAEAGVFSDGGYFTNSVYAGNVYATNLLMRGPSTFSKTNNFPANSDIAFGRYALTSLANGNNAAIPVGTNVFVEVSGPTAAFTINGINGQPNRDGKLLIILNRTGYPMTIANDSGIDPVAANRIYTESGSDLGFTGSGAVVLIYSSASSRWNIIASRGATTANLPIAAMWFEASESVTMAASTYMQITNFDGSVSSSFTVDKASGTITNSTSGYYQINLGLSFTGGNSVAYEAEMFTNGVACDAVSFERTMGTSAAIGQASAQNIIYLNSGTRVDFRIKNDGGTAAVTIEKAQVTLHGL